MAKPSAPNQPRTFRRGDVIYRAGEPATQVYLIQSGLAAITVSRAGKTIEISQVPSNQILGEEALWGSKVWNATAVANNDVRALPIDLAQARALIEQSPQLVKAYAKGVMEKQRAWSEELLEIKLESDPTPCSADQVTKLFATIYTTASYTGTKKNDAMVVVWPAFKKYAQRTFLESPVRLEQAVNILVKLGFARHEMIPCETDPEGPDELGFVHFTDLEKVREFFEFYRKCHFSGVDPASQAQGSNFDILREIDEWNAKGKVEITPPATAA